jgi:hypothetical protein
MDQQSVDLANGALKELGVQALVDGDGCVDVDGHGVLLAFGQGVTAARVRGGRVPGMDVSSRSSTKRAMAARPWKSRRSCSIGSSSRCSMGIEGRAERTVMRVACVRRTCVRVGGAALGLDAGDIGGQACRLHVGQVGGAALSGLHRAEDELSEVGADGDLQQNPRST